MYREHAWREVKRLRKQGTPIAVIARRLGIARNTVYRLLRMDEPPVFAGRMQFSSRQELAVKLFARMLINEAHAVLNSESGH